MEYGDSVTVLQGVGSEVAARLSLLGISTLGDLIHTYPRRYDDYSEVTPIQGIKEGPVTIKAVIKQAKGRYVRRGMHVTEAVASDASGSVRLVWFNQPYRAPAIKPGKEYFISGDLQLAHQRLAVMNPSMELVSDFPVHTARIVPIYREVKGLKSRAIRKLLHQAMPLIDHLPETLPDWILKDHKLISRHDALKILHFPPTMTHVAHARRRFGFEEVFSLSLGALLNKSEVEQEVSVEIPFVETVAKQFVDHLPFTLTSSQKQAAWHIYKDLAKPHPMNRLVEGDVGSGKTVVAAMAALMAIHAGWQVAYMAPTEILARQHADTLVDLFKNTTYADTISLLIGGLSTSAKKTAHTRIKDGSIKLVVGTSALIQEKVDMHRLGLVIVDEQHRFGVDQRKKLQMKAGHMPHVLTMTATPIPRSLALTLYGELDISIIDVMPAGRKPVVTKITTPAARHELYDAVEKELQAGRQAFVVCPLITESDAMPGISAETMHKALSEKWFKHRSIGLLHGKQKPEEKDRVMQDFLSHKLDILVSTTVIEVGVNVPNATVMIVEGAERFGLAQIHQLRGRVGRSDYQGYCYLVTSDAKSPSQRLRALQASTSGFELAELDLKLRGPGAIYGTAQSGQLDLRIAKLSDAKLIASAVQAAHAFIKRGEKLIQYPYLNTVVTRARAVTKLN